MENTKILKFRTRRLADKFFMFYVLGFMFLALPLFASAAGLIPCGGTTANVDNHPCAFSDFIVLAGKIIKLAVIYASLAAAVAFMYAGYAYLTSGGSQEKVSYAKGIFKKVLIGYIIILGAWVFIYGMEQTFYSTLLDKNGQPVRPSSDLGPGNPISAPS